jgi:hypothetical protein
VTGKVLQAIGVPLAAISGLALALLRFPQAFRLYPFRLYPSFAAYPFLGFIGLPISGFLIFLGKRLRSSAVDIHRHDHDSTVLYLRPFNTDVDYIEPFRALTGPPLPEEQLKAVFEDMGWAFQSVGRPGEPLPAIGADRVYVGADWHQEVARLVRKARLIVLEVDLGQSVSWETQTVFRERELSSIILILPPGGGVVWENFRASLAPILSVKLPLQLGNARALIFPSNHTKAVLIERGEYLRGLNLALGTTTGHPDGELRAAMERALELLNLAHFAKVSPCGVSGLSRTELVRHVERCWHPFCVAAHVLGDFFGDF